MKKFFSLLLTGVMSVMLLAGCGNTANDPSPASSSTPAAGAEERSITIAQSANFSMGFAPGVQSYEATYYMNNFYEGLVEYRDGEYLPCLATDWVSSDDGLTYTFHLRENVQFNDGTAFNAEAVKLYFDNMKSVIGTSANYGQLDMLTTEITVDDEYTVSFHLSRPYYNVLNDLSMAMPRGILSAAAFNEDGSLNLNPNSLTVVENCCLERSLKDAHIRLSDIDQVVLVGGATKSPVIRRFAGKLFHMIPDTKINPDEAVALGAAIQAAMKERRDGIREVILTDVCPFTLGTEVVQEYGDHQYEDGVFFPIIERNTVIPASRTERLYTVRDNQTRIRVHILQGESRFAVNNLSLGELFIEVPAGKAGQEAVDVTYTYDINSILEVEVKSVSSGKKVRQVFKGQDLDMREEEIEDRLKTLSYLKIHPRDKEENKVLLLRGERIYEESLGVKREQAGRMLREFEHALDTYDPERIAEAKREYMEFLEKLDEWE